MIQASEISIATSEVGTHNSTKTTGSTTPTVLQLPQLSAMAIARTIAHTVPDDEILGHLLILRGQYIFVSKAQDGVEYKPVSPEAVAAAFSTPAIDSGWLSNHIVRWGKGKNGEWILLYFPPQKYNILLQNTANHSLQLVFPLPALLFVGIGRTYYIWAMKGSSFDPAGNLYAAPLPNVMGEGSICFGNNLVPQCNSQNVVEIWNLFWSSPFNSDAVSHKSKQFPEDIRNQLILLHDKKAKRYPASDLVPISSWNKKTPNDIIRNLL
ncbi:prokaryotic E2 ligase family D protein [Chroococcidiopsis sp. CCNUC1]|uniref:prokaryotic E2 ligase family D protein n=1 Tax=Chroococcidiopsis sp. CCNUC1 TaxID=2653189 RepID=UPI002021D040|nr:prokaryotic E2 ligase family D protein [Chroococcidiopsis sp. CCNUC1]URD53519.1 prokaryotic E2 ligase family D protein [Chroococcidiopsis sp. CCNUC1]